MTCVNINNLPVHEINAQVMWQAFDGHADDIKTEIKAVTYHEVAVTQGLHGWNARIIFDN